jgi:hypothetical protein
MYVFSYVTLAFCGVGELLLPPIYGRNLFLNAYQPPVQVHGCWGMLWRDLGYMGSRFLEGAASSMCVRSCSTPVLTSLRTASGWDMTLRHGVLFIIYLFIYGQI